MLAMSDVNMDYFIPYFAETEVPVAFLVPTPTGFGKSIMDATTAVRTLLKNEHIHDYELQGQGQNNKVNIKAYLVFPDGMKETAASLYRPETKQGDPRIWFYNLKEYCKPCNLLALVIKNKSIYVINLSVPLVQNSLINHKYVYDLLVEIKRTNSAVSEELLRKIQIIHNQGFLPSITSGDPGVGDTLEHALGIDRNNSRQPDYKGIELKATRLTRYGKTRTPTRSTLFTKVPEIGMTYRDIVNTYGKWQIPRGHYEARFQLYETLRASRPNAYDLQLEVNGAGEALSIIHVENQTKRFVSGWIILGLQQALLLKHRETFWVKAITEERNGREYFRYDKILHTKNPNTSLLAPLLETDKITVDLAAHFKEDGQWRDHGVLFKMKPNEISLLLGKAVEYDLTTIY